MLSERANGVAPSATLHLTNRVAGMRRQGIDVIALNVGEPDFGTPDHICRAAVKAIEAQRTKYTPVPGITELREAICRKLEADNGLFYTPEQICVGAGAKQPLSNAVMALCGEGDEVILPAPCWVSYLEMVKLSGAVPILVQNAEEDGFALNLDGIEKAVTPRTKAIIINTPNNPTGAVYAKEALRRLSELAARHDFYIISDEVYEKLVFDGKRHVSVGALSPDAFARTIVINGFSKTYAMTGWRVGYAAGDRAVIKAMSAIQSHTTSNACSIAQYAALEALEGPQDSLEPMRREFERRRDFMTERLNRIPGVTCVRPEGTFYLMPNISSFYGTICGGSRIQDSFDMAEYLLERAGIAVVPGAAFEAPGSLRISFANSMENLKTAMDRMENALRVKPFR